MRCCKIITKNPLFSVYAIFNDQSFNDMLTNDIVNFEQLGPGRHFFFQFRVDSFTIGGLNTIDRVVSPSPATNQFLFPFNDKDVNGKFIEKYNQIMTVLCRIVPDELLLSIYCRNAFYFVDYIDGFYKFVSDSPAFAHR